MVIGLTVFKKAIKLNNIYETIVFWQIEVVIFERMETHKVCSTLTSTFHLGALWKSNTGTWSSNREQWSLWVEETETGTEVDEVAFEEQVPREKEAV